MKTIKLWAWYIGLGICLGFTLIQFELIAWKQAKEVLGDWLYKQMVVEAATVTPNLAIREEKAHVADLVASIYQLESSSGKNDSCKKKQSVNGYGYRPGTCYNSHETVKNLVTDWVTSMIHQGYSDSELLCYYNLGKVNGKMAKDCKYYQNYLKL